MELIENYEKVVNDIVDAFKEKQEISAEEGYWIGGHIGGIYDY